MKRLLAPLLCCALLTGCASAQGGPVGSKFREVEKLQVIQTMGFDGQPGGVTVSVSSGREGGAAGLLAAEGAGIESAVKKLQAWPARDELFFAHVRYAVVGEDAARAGLAEVLDYFLRDPQPRMDVPLFIAREATALELVTGFQEETFEITEALSSIYRDAERSGAPRCHTVLDAARHFSLGEPVLCCALRRRETGGNVFPPTDSHTALEQGYAVLKDGALLGFLDENASRGTELLLGSPGETNAVLPAGGGLYTVALSGGKVSLRPEWDEQGVPTLHIRLSYRAGLTEAAPGQGPGEDTLAALDGALSQWLLARAVAALEAAQALDADFLGLGYRLELARPDQYAGRDPGVWPPGLRWTLAAEGRVERSYGLAGPQSAAAEGHGHD